MNVRIIVADVLEALRSLPDESVHCVVTSPPYWGLRDYQTGTWVGGDPACEHRSPTMREGRNEARTTLAGSVATNSTQLLLAHRSACGKCGAVKVDQQIGLEPTLGEHLDVLVAVFREVRRVLRKDGTCWINYGDCYAAAPNGRSATATKAAGNDDRTFRDKPFGTVGAIYDPAGGASGGGYRGGAKNTHNPRGRVVAGCDAGEGPLYDPNCRTERGAFSSGDRQSRHDHGGRVVAGGYLKPKDLVMMSNRLAIALQDDGWWVRSEIVWSKVNPMPETARDRPAQAHEKIWLLTKSGRYWYDAEAVKEPVTGGAKPRRKDGQTKPAKGTHRMDRRAGSLSGNCLPDMRNLRNVWTIASDPFPGAHFATFPRHLAEICIRAGCPAGGVVLDPFGGAGTTGLVADQLGRDSILIELNPGYAEMAQRRIEAHRMHAVVTLETLAAPVAEAAE